MSWDGIQVVLHSCYSFFGLSQKGFVNQLGGKLRHRLHAVSSTFVLNCYPVLTVQHQSKTTIPESSADGDFLEGHNIHVWVIKILTNKCSSSIQLHLQSFGGDLFQKEHSKFGREMQAYNNLVKDHKHKTSSHWYMDQLSPACEADRHKFLGDGDEHGSAVCFSYKHLPP